MFNSVNFNLDNKGIRVGGGELIQTLTMGESAITPNIQPVNAKWTFHGWDKEYDYIAKNTIVNALFQLEFFDIDIVNLGAGSGKESYTKNLSVIDPEYGKDISFIPFEDSYVSLVTVNEKEVYCSSIFDSKEIILNININNEELANVKVYYQKLGSYTINFNLDNHAQYVGGGAMIQNLSHGESAKLPLLKVNDGWEFIEWTGNTIFVTESMNVVANYKRKKCEVYFDLKTKGKRIGGGNLIQKVDYETDSHLPLVEAMEGFEFLSWDNTGTNILDNTLITAQYKPLEHKVTFLANEQGTVSGGGDSIQQVIHGETAFAPEIIANVGWKFVGWNKNITNIQQETIINGIFVEENPSTFYNVIFDLGKHGDLVNGKLNQTISKGSDAIMPIIQIDEGMEINSIVGDYKNINKDTTITFSYQKALCKVLFDKNGKGEHIGGGALNQFVEYGQTVELPSLLEEENYVLVWNDNSSSIKEDKLISAIWTKPNFNIQFNIGGEAIRTGGGALNQFIEKGDDVFAPTLKILDGWIFKGWDKKFNNIIDNVIVNAIYERKTCKVTFNLGQHAQLKTGTLEQIINYGDNAISPSYITTPGWNFISWNDSLFNIKEDKTLTALYDRKEHSVYFDLDDKGTLINGNLTQTIEYGKDALIPEVKGINDYVFLGWSGENCNVRDDRYIKAMYMEQAYSVKFVIGDAIVKNGSLMHTTSYGKSIEAPLVQAKDNKIFAGWDKEFYNVTKNLVINAKFIDAQLEDTFTVTFNSADGTIIGGGEQTQIVQSSGSAHTPLIKAPTNYKFTGWDKEYNNITKDIVINAEYNLKNYKVQFYIPNSCANLSHNAIQTIEHGRDALAPNIKCPNGYVIEWLEAYKNVTQNKNIFAKLVKKKYKVTYYLNKHVIHPSNFPYITFDVEYGHRAPVPEYLEIDGWKMIGWTNEEQLANVTEDMSVNAMCKQIKHKVSYVYNKNSLRHVGGGNIVQYVNHGEDAYPPTFDGIELIPNTFAMEFVGYEENSENIVDETVVVVLQQIKKTVHMYDLVSHGTYKGTNLFEIEFIKYNRSGEVINDGNLNPEYLEIESGKRLKDYTITQIEPYHYLYTANYETSII